MAKNIFHSWLLRNRWIQIPVYKLFQIYWHVFQPKTYGVKCVIRYQGKLLMIRNTYGKTLWTFPGGGIDNGETEEEAARREVKEEVGIDVSDLRRIGKFTSSAEGKRDTVTAFATDAGSEYFEIDPGEILEARWFSLDVLPQTSEYARKIIATLGPRGGSGFGD